jgi:hypothetical protein
LTIITELNIDGTNRKADHIGAIVINRRINAVGDMTLQLDNTAGTYDDLLSPEHQYIYLDLGGSRFWYGHVHNVDSVGRDDKGRWEKHVEVQAWDQAEELTFKDDFEKTYNVADQTLDDVLDDVLNHALTWNHIIYSQGTCPDLPVGSFEKKEGQSLLTFLQELHRSVDCLFYVDDSGYFRSQSLAGISPSGVTLSRGNLVSEVRFRRMDADKLYNYVKLYGKNPLFDAWTDLNASSWDGLFTPEDDTSTKRVGVASVKTTRTSGTSSPNLELDFSSGLFNYTSLDLTKGEIGMWVRYDGVSALSPRAIRVQLYDGSNTINYYSGNVSLFITSQVNRTQAYKDYWSWITVPLGVQPDTSTNICDHWWPVPLSGEFDWANVEKINIQYEQASSSDYPDNFWVDGLCLPVAPIAIASDGPFGTAKERRPLVASRADLRTQMAIQRAADTLLLQHKSPAIDAITGRFAGDTELRYAGLGFVADFPMDISSLDFYVSRLVHTIAPYQDVAKGWDHIMDVEGVLLNVRAYDMSRLSPGGFGYSIPGIGLKEK